MGFWNRLLRREAKMSSLELFREVYGHARESKAGPVVNVKTALEVATILAISRVLCEGVAQVPFKLYRETRQGSEPALEHSLYNVLYRRPNGWQTSFEYRETLMLHTVLCGAHFSFINRVGIAGKVRELIPIEPHRVEVIRRPDLTLDYKVCADDGSYQMFPQEAIWHVRGPSWNSWLALDATKMARNAIGLAVSLEQGQSEFQKNGAKVAGILSVEDKLNQAQYEGLAAWLDRHEIGGDRSNKALVVDRNAKYHPTAMTGVDQQLLETRKHQIEEICRAFRVMPIMIGQSDKAATYASAEQMFLAHVVHTLSPWYQRIEQSADVNLLSQAERDAGYYTKFNPNALMRGASKDRAEFYAKALGSGGTKGWMTQNDVRSLEDLNRSEDPEADKLPQPTTRQPTATPPREDE